MDQLTDFADDRLIRGCIYCGGTAETRDHVPSRCLLEKPYPTNLPVVGCCDTCNQSFSLDEEYLVCLVESVLCGSTDPDDIKRPSVARKMRKSPALRARIEQSRTVQDGQDAFVPEWDRIANVMLKLARGHAAFDLSQLRREEPDHFWCDALSTLPEDQRERFVAPHKQHMIGEVGSRNLQRMFILQATLQSESGDEQNMAVLINDWVNVQDGLYRYIAIDDSGGVVIRILLSETLACEVAWNRNAA